MDNGEPVHQAYTDLQPATTLSEAVAILQQRFRACDIPDAGRDARLLVERVLGLESGAHIRRASQPVGQHAAALAAAGERRLAREPVSRILGNREFYGRPFIVSPATLDPRPDSETLIEAALGLLATLPSRTAPRILDIGTGTGCLLITLLAECPAATGIGTDISAGALELAARNARDLGVADRASWMLSRSRPPAGMSFDLVLSNPPYIRSAEIAGLAPEVRLYDPQAALDGGDDGLDVYREILAGLSLDALGGWGLFEVGYDQATAVSDLIAARYGASASEFRTYADLGGHTRCVAWLPQLHA